MRLVRNFGFIRKIILGSGRSVEGSSIDTRRWALRSTVSTARYACRRRRSCCGKMTRPPTETAGGLEPSRTRGGGSTERGIPSRVQFAYAAAVYGAIPQLEGQKCGLPEGAASYLPSSDLSIVICPVGVGGTAECGAGAEDGRACSALALASAKSPSATMNRVYPQGGSINAVVGRRISQVGSRSSPRGKISSSGRKSSRANQRRN